MSDSDVPLVSFVVPLYNTGAALTRLLDAFRGIPLMDPWELVLVNDGSPDGTGARVEEAIPRLPYPVTFVDMARNYGEHAAVLEGYRHVRGQYVINLDDDLQNPLSEALKVLDHLRHGNDEVVYTYYEEKQHHWFRNLGSWLTNRLACFLLDKPKDLYLSSFRGLRRELVERIAANRGAFPYIDGLILGATNRIGRIRVAHAERAQGQSTYTARKLIRLWMNMFFNFSVMPLRVASVLGLILAGFGCAILCLALFERFSDHHLVPGWASLMAAVAIFSGAQLLMLGLIGEYLGRAYLTLAGRPQSLVRHCHRHVPPKP